MVIAIGIKFTFDSFYWNKRKIKFIVYIFNVSKDILKTKYTFYMLSKYNQPVIVYILRFQKIFSILPVHIPC